MSDGVTQLVSGGVGALSVGAVVWFLLKSHIERLSRENLELRGDQQEQKRRIDEECLRRIDANNRRIQELREQNAREDERMGALLDKLSRVDFGVLQSQVAYLNRVIEQLLQNERDTQVELKSLITMAETTNERINRAHEKADLAKRDAQNALRRTDMLEKELHG